MTPKIELFNEEYVRVTIGDWSTIIDGFEKPDEEFITSMQEQCPTLYDFIGLSLHGVQQGVQTLNYKMMSVHARDIEDTNGSFVSDETVVTIGGLNFLIRMLCEDDKLEWKI